MRVKTGLAVGMLALVIGGCSLLRKPCPDPSSCECPTTTNQACPPWPDDDGDNPSQMAKKKPDGGLR